MFKKINDALDEFFGETVKKAFLGMLGTILLTTIIAVIFTSIQTSHVLLMGICSFVLAGLGFYVIKKAGGI